MCRKRAATRFSSGHSLIINRIYKNLLTSDILSSIKSIPIPGQDPSLPPSAVTSKYELSPAVLRVCRQIHDEAIEILYHDNVFLIDMQSSWAWFSPLNRQYLPINAYNQHLDKVSFAASPKGFFAHKTLSKVRHLKLFISTDSPYEDPSPPSQQIFELCKLLARIRLHSLVLVAVPYSTDRNNPTLGPVCQCSNLRWIVRPFRRLRNIPGFKLIEGRESMSTVSPSLHTMLPPMLGGLVPPPAAPTYRKHPEFKKLKVELEALIRSDTPVSKLPQMYTSLVKYAQAFERNVAYKAEVSCFFEREFHIW